MKTIQVEDDVYEFIVRHTLEIGESASSILRRLFGMSKGTRTNAAAAVTASPVHELSAVLAEPIFTRSSTAVSRMLRILEEVHKQRSTEFAKVLKIGGRKRTYFARSESEILNSGQSTQPQEIDGTGYWVMTNSPTAMKREMIRSVLGALGYSRVAVEEAVKVI